MSSSEVDERIRRKILDILFDGEPRAEMELYHKMGDFVTFEKFIEQVKYLMSKEMIRAKTVEGIEDCDSEEIDVEILIYWVPHYHETINKKKEAKELARPYMQAMINEAKDLIEQMEKELGRDK